MGHVEKLRLGTVNRAQEKLLTKVQPSCSRRLQTFGDASTMGPPPKTASAAERSWPELRRQAVCVEHGAGEMTQAPWRSPEDCESLQLRDIII
ncbi:hypothetical protein LEMLEM_LOCUS22385 [Lemmus lemmus]